MTATFPLILALLAGLPPSDTIPSGAIPSGAIPPDTIPPAAMRTVTSGS